MMLVNTFSDDGKWSRQEIDIPDSFDNFDEVIDGLGFNRYSIYGDDASDHIELRVHDDGRWIGILGSPDRWEIVLFPSIGGALEFMRLYSPFLCREKLDA